MQRVAERHGGETEKKTDHVPKEQRIPTVFVEGEIEIDDEDDDDNNDDDDDTTIQ